MTTVEESQIDLINSNRLYSVTTMLLGAFLIYFLLSEKIDSAIFTYWLYMIVSVDIFRMFAAIAFKYDKKKNRVNYKLAQLHLLIGTILSGSCWGSLSMIALPKLEIQGIMVVIVVLVVLSTASTTTLSYRFKLSAIFITLVLFPLMYSLTIQNHVIGRELYIIYIAIFALIVFSLKHSKNLYQSIQHMLELQLEASRQEKELIVQRENAELANLTKSKFLANMSHELRTPMHAILGFSDLGSGKSGAAPIDKVATYFSHINESGQRLLLLINDLLDLSKLEAGQMRFNLEKNNLQHTLNSVVEELTPLFDERSLTVGIKRSVVEKVAIYDDDKIAQVIRNLLSNAIKFSPEGSEITVFFDAAILYLEDETGSDNQLPAISLSVQDKGIGIPEGEHETVFNEFVQSSKVESGAGGTGLGLSISRSIVEFHSGIIKAANAIDEPGSVFTFILPYTPLSSRENGPV